MADISKLKLASGSVLNLKDAKVRADLAELIAALKDAAYKDVISAVADINTANLPTGAVVKEYVDAQIGTINKFDVRVADSLPTADATTMYILYLIPESGATGVYVEYITVRSGSEGSYTYSWERIGTTETDLADYLKIVDAQAFEVAGVAFGNDNAISANELITALGLGDLAFANTATGSTTLDTIDTITMGAVTVAGNAAVTTTATTASLTKGNYTPAGSITGNAISGGSIDVTLTDASSGSPATLTTADYTPTGSVSVTLKNAGVLASVATPGTLPSKAADTFTANTPTAIDVTKFNGGSAATWTGASHTAASLGNATKSAFATEGITAHVASGAEISGDVDAETLIFSAAGTSNAVTEQGAFTPDSVDFGTFDGGTAASLASGFYSAGTAASFSEGAFSAGAMPTFTEGTVGVDTTTFSGDKAQDLQVTGVTYLKQVVDTKTFTPTAASLGFSGTEAENVLVTAVTYDKADATAAFSETVTPTVSAYNKTAKTVEITVNPD